MRCHRRKVTFRAGQTASHFLPKWCIPKSKSVVVRLRRVLQEFHKSFLQEYTTRVPCSVPQEWSVPQECPTMVSIGNIWRDSCGNRKIIDILIIKACSVVTNRNGIDWWIFSRDIMSLWPRNSHTRDLWFMGTKKGP